VRILTEGIKEALGSDAHSSEPNVVNGLTRVKAQKTLDVTKNICPIGLRKYVKYLKIRILLTFLNISFLALYECPYMYA
jgi:hypothetical protein